VWYDEAQNYIAFGAIITAAVLWFVVRTRSALLIVAALAAGAYFGIQVTARGWVKLPLGPMQKQMHEVWGIPTERLQPPL